MRPANRSGCKDKAAATELGPWHPLWMRMPTATVGMAAIAPGYAVWRLSMKKDAIRHPTHTAAIIPLCLNWFGTVCPIIATSAPVSSCQDREDVLKKACDGLYHTSHTLDANEASHTAATSIASRRRLSDDETSPRASRRESAKNSAMVIGHTR